MKTILTYQCVCGEDIYEDDVECISCGMGADPERLREEEVVEITHEKIS